MWCLCSHIATPIYKALVPSVTATSLPRRRCHAVFTNQQQQVGESGHHTLFAATLQSSNPTPIRKEGEEAQISGSDVLWALQRASALKKMKKKKKIKQDHGRGLSSAATPMEENTVDYTNVRPLCINTNWGAKLDELEKRLHELSHTI